MVADLKPIQDYIRGIERKLALGDATEHTLPERSELPLVHLLQDPRFGRQAALFLLWLPAFS
ncbi:hypothetical protein ES703_24891 [subsurface metagenome]